MAGVIWPLINAGHSSFRHCVCIFWVKKYSLMQTEDIYMETALLQLQLQNKREQFEAAIEHDLALRETKEIFHEIKLLKKRLLEIQRSAVAEHP
jgi:hypothetical protein